MEKGYFKMLSIMIFLLSCNSCVNSSNKENDQYTENLTYSINEEGTGYYVSNGINNEPKVVIPSTYNNLPVVGVSKYGFANTNITQVVMPETIIEIENNAFENCKYLENVVFSDSLEVIGALAFRYCENIGEINLPDSVNEIHLQAFSYCSSLRKLYLPENLKYLANNIVIYEHANKNLFKTYKGFAYLGSKKNPYLAMVECLDLQRTNIKTHRDCKFISSKSIISPSSITLTSKVEYFDMKVGSEKLEYVKGNPKIKYIGPYSFADSTNLKTFPSLEYLKHVEIRAFKDSNIPFSSVDLKNIEYIGYNAFISITGASSFKLGNKLKEFDMNSLSFDILMKGEKIIYIPSSVEKIINIKNITSKVTIYYELSLGRFLSICNVEKESDLNVNVVCNYQM